MYKLRQSAATRAWSTSSATSRAPSTKDYVLVLGDKKIEYEKNNMNEEVRLEIITDANWRGEADAKSTSGGVLRLGSWILQTWSRTQPVVRSPLAASRSYSP